MLINKLIRIGTKIKRHREFSVFQSKIHKATYDEYASIIKWAELQSEYCVTDAPCSPIVKRGDELRNAVLNEFHNKYRSITALRVLIHVPPANISPAGFSIFTNLVDTLVYLGIPCQRLEWNDKISGHLTTFAPTVLMTSDSTDYLQRLDWKAIKNYKASHGIRIGLTASIEAYGNSPLQGRLQWAKKNGIDFYYNFGAPEYLKARKDYSKFFEEGYEIHSIEFGANPLLYFPVDGIDRDIPFVFLGSSNADKQKRYIEWFGQIVNEYPGFINGPGWKGMNSSIPMNLNKFIYARAKVGINLHIDDQVTWGRELNERTYTLAACGIPQLIDNPKLLLGRFSKGAMFHASSPKEYLDLFHCILASPDEAQARASLSLEEVYKKHTTFHRAEGFIKQLGISL